jgi:hypothetical protein
MVLTDVPYQKPLSANIMLLNASGTTKKKNCSESVESMSGRPHSGHRNSLAERSLSKVVPPHSLETHIS